MSDIIASLKVKSIKSRIQKLCIFLLKYFCLSFIFRNPHSQSLIEVGIVLVGCLNLQLKPTFDCLGQHSLAPVVDAGSDRF